MRAARAGVTAVAPILRRALVLASVLALAGCGSTAEGEARSGQTAGAATTCMAGLAGTCTQPSPSYANDVAPILERDCNRPCHAPGLGPWPLTTYEDVQAWGVAILSDVASCAMPPPDAGTITAADQETIVDWVACGAANN
jgi:hypothetical protein